MWFWFALASAFLGAVDTNLRKNVLSKISPSVLTWSVFVLPIPLMVVVALMNPINHIPFGFWYGATISGLIFLFSDILTNRSLKNSSVSRISPFTAVGVLLTYLTSLIFLKETVSGLAVIGLLSIVTGSYVLNLKDQTKGLFQPFIDLTKDKTLLIFFAALIINSISAVFDKTALNSLNPSNPALVLLWESVIIGIGCSLILFKNQPTFIVKQIKPNIRTIIICALVYAVVSILVFTGMANGPIALVVAVKRLQIFIALFIAKYWLKEKPTKVVWIGSIFMILGVVLIKLG